MTTAANAGGTSVIKTGNTNPLVFKGLTPGLDLVVESGTDELKIRNKRLREVNNFKDDFEYNCQGSDLLLTDVNNPFVKSNVWSVIGTTGIGAQICQMSEEGSDTRIGVIKSQNSLGTGAGGYILQARGATMIPGNNHGEICYETSIWLESPNVYPYYWFNFGIMNNNNINNKIGFSIFSAHDIDGRDLYVCLNNGHTSTIYDTTVARNHTYDTWVTYRIIINSAGTNIKYYINNTEVGNLIPFNLDTAYSPFIEFERTGTAQLFRYSVDYVELKRQQANQYRS